MNIFINNVTFLQRIQDIGCTDVELPQKSYRQAKILSVGPMGGENSFIILLFLMLTTPSRCLLCLMRDLLGIISFLYQTHTK